MDETQPRPRARRASQPATEFRRKSGCLDLWEIDLARPIADSDRELLDKEERAKADRLIIESKQRQSYRARSELRRILARYLELDPAQLRFCYGEFGKPALAPAGSKPAPLCFNLSHSGDFGLVGVVFEAPALRLGVDIEEARLGREFAGIAERFFAPDEVEVFQSIAPADQPAAFYRAWTRKEAYLKAIGTGLSFSSAGFSIRFARGEPAELLATSRPGDDPRRWRMADLACPPGYAAAACWDGGPLELRHYYAPESAPSPNPNPKAS